MTSFQFDEATDREVWLRREDGRRVRVSWGLLTDLADEENPHNYPEQAKVYADVLAQAHVQVGDRPCG